MADTFSNDLRVRLQESGSNAGTWGDLLNGTITNIASALGQGSEAIPNASTHTITLADGTADEARSLYLKCTGGGQACTVTLGPNTISKVWIIDNATSYTLTFRQGSGVNVAIAAGAVKVIATDGAGSGAAVVDTLDGLEGSLKTLAVNSGATTETTAAAIGYNGDAGTNLYINTDHGNNLVSLYASGSASKEMRFLSGTLEVMRLGTTGNVGVGTGANAISHQLVSYKSGANANYVQIASGSTGLGATNGLRLGVSSAGIGEIYSQSASPVMTFNAGNVGIGVVPSAWGTGAGIRGLEVGANLAASQDINSVYFSANAYNSATGWKYRNTQYAANLRMGTNDSVFQFQQAASGSAGAAITWATSTLDASGNLLVA